MRTEVELSRSEILNRAEGIAITMLPDLTVVDTSEDAENAARALVRFWENEAHRIGETICYAGDGPIVANDQLSE